MTQEERNHCYLFSLKISKRYYQTRATVREFNTVATPFIDMVCSRPQNNSLFFIYE